MVFVELVESVSKFCFTPRGICHHSNVIAFDIEVLLATLMIKLVMLLIELYHGLFIQVFRSQHLLRVAAFVGILVNRHHFLLI